MESRDWLYFPPIFFSELVSGALYTRRDKPIPKRMSLCPESPSFNDHKKKAVSAIFASMVAFCSPKRAY